MASEFPADVTVQKYSGAECQPPKRPFAERLKSFSGNVDKSHAAEAVGPSRMPYWSRDDPWEGRPPKSVWYIRWILWRIRRWVHGG
jgi:hypothetical protein